MVLDFERPLVEIQKRIAQLRELERGNGVNLSASILQLETQVAVLEAKIFKHLTPWQRTMVSRHPARPYTLDYVSGLFTEWLELHGDRAGHDDDALVCGMARFRGQPVVVMGHQKGRNTKENIKRNFGMARPEGYRKALRIMRLAEDFNVPIITFIDTPGAYPGIDAEERGQAEAIARNILEMARFTVPIIAVIIGEGGSGGALAVGVANRVLMLQNSVYSVISPEGCAAILWRDRAEGEQAASALGITASDCFAHGVVDEVIDEPLGGAHRHKDETVQAVGKVLHTHLQELLQQERAALRADRYERFRKLGTFEMAASS